jgi:DHA2 family methylenomycin A resistance protein-like MFS transporter
LFAWVERRHPDPMLPLKLFQSKEFSGSTVVGLALNLSFYGTLFLLPLYFHQRGFSAAATGLALFPMVAMAVVASPLGGRHTARFGGRAVMLIGLTVGAAGFVGLALINWDTGYPLLALPLMAVGFGIAYTMPAATVRIIDAAPRDRAGIASGALNASRQTGGAVGVALFGSFVASAAGFMPGFQLSEFAGAAAFFGAALVTALTVRRSTR